MLNSFHQETLLVYFGTTKCGPCHLMKKELVKAKKLLANKQEEEDEKSKDVVKIFYLDTEKWPHLGTRFRIQRLPCILLVRHGVVLKRLEGVTRADLIVEELRNVH